jgi:transcriptional regulator with XRE-family HTH domain
MSKKTAELSDDIPEILREYLATVPPVTEAMRADLRAAAKELDHDPKFQAEYIKGLFVNFMLEAMNEEKLSQSEVARKWGRSRQYLHKLLNEDKRVNFTVDTMVELAMLLGRRIEMHVFKQSEAAHVLRCVIRQPSLSLSEEPSVARSRAAEFLTAPFTPFETHPDYANEERLSA